MYRDVHPGNPQPRVIGKAVEVIRSGGLIVYPTDCCYALGAQVDNGKAKSGRIAGVRHLASDITSR